ncbi:MAG: DUF2723 domain-containing protein [Anaerolineae bacterium]|nr:DUF2723 domain-containing protein [Anaerolineae bacterium]
MHPIHAARIDTRRLAPLLLFFMALLFYVPALAPTVVWSDSAHLQRMAAQGLIDRDGAGRPVWFVAARLMLLLPVGDPAYRLNLLSALSAAAAVALTHQAALAAGISRRGALAAALALAVSHTFWQHAVRAEVYATFMALIALQVWLWFKWRPHRPAPFFVAVALLGPLLLTHQMAALLAPALLFLVVRRRAWLRPKQWFAVSALATVSLLAALLVLQWQMQASPIRALATYLTHSGVDWRPAFFDFSWPSLPRDMLLFGAFVLLQFPSPALLLAAIAAVDAPRRARLDAAWGALLLLALADLLFAFAYRVNDRYVFFMPLYGALALLVGLGWDVAERMWPALKMRGAYAALMALLVAAPVVAYASAPAILLRLNMNPLDVRVLPGREPNRYFLWPPLAGYRGAADYARASFAVAPPGSLIIADYAPFEALSYAQQIEAAGPGVSVVKVEPPDDLRAVIDTFPPDTPVFLADTDPRHYNLASLGDVRLERDGFLYRLVR